MLVTAGAWILAGALFYALYEAVVYLILTPTKKTPARAGDLENRRWFGWAIKLDLILAAAGAVALASGLLAQSP